jgi:hypothetical protein
MPAPPTRLRHRHRHRHRHLIGRAFFAECPRMRTDLVIEALDMAVQTRRPQAGVISRAHRELLRQCRQ